jgi:hypothetical protein
MSARHSDPEALRMLRIRPLFTLCFALLLYWLATPLAAYNLIASSPYHELYSNRPPRSSDRELSKVLAEKFGDLQMQFGVYPEGRVPIYIVYGEAEYHKLSLGKAQIVEFSDAFYSGSERAIYARSKDQVLDNYLKILQHEYLHWYIEELFTYAPLWFHEGMATYFSGQIGYERFLVYLKESLVNPRSDLFRLGHKYPDNREDWSRFYLSSAMAVRYMQDRHPQQWQSFWEAVAQSYRQGRRIRFSEAFVNSYQISLWDFHTKFGIHSKRQGYTYLLIAFNSLIFALMPFLMIAIVRKRRKKLLGMPDLPLPEEEEEPPEADAEADRT